MLQNDKVLFWVLLDRSERFAWSGKPLAGKLPIAGMTPIVPEFDPDCVNKFKSREDAVLVAHSLAKRHLIVLSDGSLGFSSFLPSFLGMKNTP
jgi:hypothetical protein